MYRPADELVEPARATPNDFAELPTEHLEAELCELSAHLAAGMARPQRQHLVVHVDAEALEGKAHGRAELEHGPAVAPETAQRLGCDASLQVLVKRGKQML